MTYLEIKELCRKGKVGIVPNWKGYLQYDYTTDTLQFVNDNYIMTQDQLEGNYGISNRNDLYYII